MNAAVFLRLNPVRNGEVEAHVEIVAPFRPQPVGPWWAGPYLLVEGLDRQQEQIDLRNRGKLLHDYPTAAVQVLAEHVDPRRNACAEVAEVIGFRLHLLERTVLDDRWEYLRAAMTEDLRKRGLASTGR